MRFSFSILFVTLIAVSSSCYASPPALFQTCPNLNRIDGIGLVLFDSDCKSAYLLPSPVGALKVTGLFVNVSDADCDAVRAAESMALGAFGDAADRNEKRKLLQSEMSQLQPDLDAAASDVSIYTAIAASASTASDKAAKDVDELSKTFAATCGGDENKNFNCLGLSGDLNKKKRELSASDDKRTKANALLKDSQDRKAAIQARLTSLAQSIEALKVSSITPEYQASALKALATLHEQQGAVVSATLTTPLVQELKRLRDANPNSAFSIEQIRIESGGLYAAGTKKGPVELVGQPSLEIPGQEIETGGTLFVNASGAKLTLDAVAACQGFNYKRPANNNLSVITDQIAAAIVAKAYLKYKAALRAKIEVRMDYAKFYELLVKTESRNGFFRTSTVRSVSEKLVASNSLSVKISDEGAMSADAKDALQTAIRDRVIQRALDFLNPKYVGVDPSASPGAPVAGAPQLSKELRKCPNQWCQVGAIVVDVANSIFGGSSSIQQFVQNLNVASVETYDKSDVFEFVTDLAFVPRK